jgi:hypothetical protein
VSVKQVNDYINKRAQAGEQIDFEEARRRFNSQNIEIQ